jgi:hypothetical protein
MIDQSKLTPKHGSYAIASQRAVSDPQLMGIATEYETNFSRKMISLNPEQLEKRFTTTDLILQTTKFDGEGVFVFFDQEQCFIFNAPSGRVRVGLPALLELQKHLQAQKIKKTLLRCELYYPFPIGNKRAGIGDVIRISFSGTLAEITALRLVILDIIMLDGKDLRPNRSDFGKTWSLLAELFGTDQNLPFFRAEGSIIPEKDLSLCFTQKINSGAEGLVIHRLHRSEVYKVKPQVSLDCVVIGYVEGEYEGLYGITSILVALTYPPAHSVFQTLLRVGSGFDDKQRSNFLALFSQHKVESPLAMTDNNGRPVIFIKPSYIVEINCEDVNITDRDNLTQTFQWDGQSYKFMGLHPSPRPIFPTFARLRDDKEITQGGARLDQVISDPQVPTPPPPDLSGAEVVRREVYQKGEMIRKLVVVKTAREGAVPYLIYWTDFSAKRKEPLDIKVSYAYEPDRVQQIADQLIAQNIVKGWQRIT